GSQLGMLSADGRCKTFDRSANGYVKGEGVGVLVLKPLGRAVADGNTIHGVIRATAEGHGGKASSLTAPNPQAQASLVFDAWKGAGVPIDSVSYIEAHGTGTELGDPLEVEALTTAFRKLAQAQGISLAEGGCGLGSVKSNIGHLEPAAGVAGLIKVLLAMRHGRLPATLHVKEVNPYLKLEGSPFRLVREAALWTGSPLRAGVSAFGFGGSNAHVALESWPGAPAEPAAGQAPLHCIVPLSAKTPAALRERVTAMCDHLGRQAVPWRDLVFTLQHGREIFEHRLDVGASSVAEVLAQWRGWLGGSLIPPVTPFEHLAKGRLLSLPTYPFARTPIWFHRQPTAAVRPAEPAVAAAPMQQQRPQPKPAPTAPALTVGPSLAEIRAILAELLYLPAESIADDARFVDLGLDSILAVEFAKKLQDSFAIDLRATRLYDYSSVVELAAHIDGARAQPRSGAASEGPLQPTHAEAAPGVAAELLPPPAVPLPDAGAALAEIRAMLAELLYLEPAAIEDDTPFVELGLDSILAVEFAKKLQDHYAIDLRATRLYDHACVGDLARWIASVPATPPKANHLVVPPAVSAKVTAAAAPAAAEPAVQPATVPAPADQGDGDIAIVGMAARYPGANDVHALWRNLAAGVDSVADVPKERWLVDPLYPHQTYCRKGGFIDGVDQFDPLFFKISPQEAEWMDPQQRLFLEQGWLALEDAGIPERLSSGMRCAVFAGAGQGDYFLAMDPKAEAGAQFGMGNVSSILAARLSYFLNLKGPAISLDTACSSSLVATHLAAQSLRSGECDVALAGGVMLMITPQLHVRACQTRMLSPQGHCKSFDAQANGFVPAEGVGVVVLKRLRDAIAEGDRIHAVIRGSGTNQDGRTNGITAPSAKSQAALALDVYRRFGIDPSTITCVEAHGTGTELGDPIEVEALTEAFRHYTPASQYCAIGSIKSNIGHSMPAAGVGGLIKAVLMLRERKIAPSLHCAEENPKIDFASSPFYVAQELHDWQPPAGVPRRVVVSSFGFSGTNAHLVLEEWKEAPLGAPASQGPWSFVLS
ncbi:MAG: beta-ketoacyl synthase N-terminal-like domain-containing protein, partial [Ramlibacter sp.]